MGFKEFEGTPSAPSAGHSGLWEGRKRVSRGQITSPQALPGGRGSRGHPRSCQTRQHPDAALPTQEGHEASPGSSVLRLAPARRPSPPLSSVLGSWEPGPGLPARQPDKVHGAPGHGSGGVGQLVGGFWAGEWQQGDSLVGPVVAGEGVPLAVGVKATGLWVDFRAFSWAGSCGSRWWSSGFRCRVGERLSPAQPPRRASGWGECVGTLGRAGPQQRGSGALGPHWVGSGLVPGTGWPAAAAAAVGAEVGAEVGAAVGAAGRRAPAAAGTGTSSTWGAGLGVACGRWGPGPRTWGATARPGP